MRSLNFAACMRVLLGLCLVMLLGMLVPKASAQRFLPDDPLWEDPDRLDMPAPEEQEISDYYDFVENVVGDPGDYEGPALNTNTVEEVPNSSWYTLRHYYHPMSIEELKRGPNTTFHGPSKEGPWKVVDVKDEGKSIGMEIIDARGDRYLLKFDPKGHIELSTGAEVVSTKLFHALGYHVPENYAVRFERDRLVPGEETSISNRDIRALLQKAARYEDATYRALASKFLEGEKPLGPFLYYGTRLDDGNDIFAHEARRELRGLRVFSAWLQHDDARSVNSLDMLVQEDGKQYVRHHLIDFGSTLGGGPIGPKDRWIGHEYVLDLWPMMARAVSLGFAGSGWADVEYPGHPSVGRFEAEHFDPLEWKPQYPNPAFRRMDAHDAFWAAKQVMHFTDEEIRAIVSTGNYSDPEAEAYLAEVLMKRRDKIGQAYLKLGGGLDRFRVEGDSLIFDDLLARHDLADSTRKRRVTWRVFHNRVDAAGAVLADTVSAAEALPLPEEKHPYLMVTLHRPGQGRTHAYLRRDGTTYEVVGLEREEEPPPSPPLPAAPAPQTTSAKAGAAQE